MASRKRSAAVAADAPSSQPGELVQIEKPSDLPAMIVTPTPMHMLQMAVQQGADIDKLKQLMDLQERWEKNEAKKAFVVAMARFKANPPQIVKDKLVSFQNRDNTVTTYKHATLAGVCDAVAAGLGEVGISHRWSTSQGEGGRVTVECILTHEMGHSESVSLSGPSDQSGGKNNIQAIGSTVSYLQRYTLMAATGLAAHDQDDDAGKFGDDPELITEEQAKQLKSEIENGGGNVAQFLRVLKVEKIEEIRAANFESVMKMVEQRNRNAAARAAGAKK